MDRCGMYMYSGASGGCCQSGLRIDLSSFDSKLSRRYMRLVLIARRPSLPRPIPSCWLPANALSTLPSLPTSSSPAHLQLPACQTPLRLH